MTRRAPRPHRSRDPGFLPWRLFERRVAPVALLSADAVIAIHEAALTILEEIGMRVLEPRARRLYAAAGAEIDGMDVRFDRALVMERLAGVPGEFTLAARNPARALKLGGNWTVFSSVGGPAFVTDAVRGRRSGGIADFRDYLRLIQMLDILHQEGGGPFEPMDLPPATRHLDMALAQITLLDKNWQPATLGARRVEDHLDMLALSLGLSREALRGVPAFTGIINTNSPLQLDVPMAEGLMTLAENGQVAVVTPFTLAGAMSPVTLAGALAQQHAEALAGILLTQIVRPGVPVMYGGFTSNVDMKSGAPAFGTPEYVQAAQATGQLARFIGVPWRSSSATSSHAPDAQAAAESALSLWGALTGGAHMVLHAAGWLGGGLTASFEKLILDAELLQMMALSFEPFPVTAETLALDAVREVGPGGHYFGARHTLARYEHAFHAPVVSNPENFDVWTERGSRDAAARAAEIWPRLLATYEAPPLEAARREALEEFVARRKREGGVPTN